jgi:transmembrane sensor
VTEAAFKAWVADPAHARAFARVTETWEVIPGAERPAPTAWRRRMPALAAACLALAVAVAGLAAWTLHDPVYTTEVGQQQSVRLSDGTRATLNTDTRLVVDYRDNERRVRLDRGEAIFEVAKNPRRPFIVAAGADEVRALGTTFVVRKDRTRLAVTLIEGRVEVRQRAAGRPAPTKIAILAPGERLTVRADEPAAVDRPKVEAATAWRRGELMFDDASLADAVAELNRYGGEPVTFGDPRVGGLRVSGVFKAGDPEEFARVVAELHGLRLRQGDGEIVLSR